MSSVAASRDPEETIGAGIEAATARLAQAGIPGSRLDAELLLAHACGSDRTALYANWRRPLSPPARERFAALLRRRLEREPLAYIRGSQEFWSLDFLVSPAVLIPRPETELLVELALRVAGGPRTAGVLAPCICDVGTGSGCIAVALARELPSAAISAVDLSSTALALARTNARRHQVADRIRFLQGDLLSAVAEARFEIIVSNPPYVASDALPALAPELHCEPRRALDGGSAGLEVITRLLSQAHACLKSAGWLVLEIGADQGPAVAELAGRAGFRRVAIEPDYAGLPRALLAQR